MNGQEEDNLKSILIKIIKMKHSDILIGKLKTDIIKLKKIINGQIKAAGKFSDYLQFIIYSKKFTLSAGVY